MPQKSTSAPKSENIVHHFFEYVSIVHHGFIQVGEMVSQAYYLEILRHLRNLIRKKDHKYGLQEHDTSITAMHQLSQN
jgi:hypothetical protein